MGRIKITLFRVALVLGMFAGVSGCSSENHFIEPEIPDLPKPLARMEYDLHIEVAVASLETVEMEVSYSDSTNYVSLGILYLRDGVEGSVVEFSDDTSETYGEFISKMNNGEDDLIRIESRYGGALGGLYRSERLESQRLLKRIDDDGVPDMIGAPVARVEALIEQVSIESPGRNPNGDGIWADILIRVVYCFY